MRFGWLAAAAAMVLGAAQASAATWVTYTLAGSGSGNSVEPITGVMRTSDYQYTVSYTVDIGVAPAGAGYAATGTYFAYPGAGNTVFATSEPGLLTFRQYSPMPNNEVLSDFTVRIDPRLNPIGFPASLNASATGQGSITYYIRQGTLLSVQGGVDRIASISASAYAVPVYNVTAVPEPASWALMIAGVGFVGGVARRRRTAVSYS